MKSKIIVIVFSLCYISILHGQTISKLVSVETYKDSIDAQILKDTVVDLDGNVYHTIKIGSQIWMVENLKVTHFRNGDAVLNVQDSLQWINLTESAYCNYRNDLNFSKKHGRLYNGYVVVDSRNIAPLGWHIPSDSELTVFANYCGLKETGIGREIPYKLNAIERDFSALKGGDGHCFGGHFFNVDNHTYWWSKTEINAHMLYCFYMSYFYRNVEKVAYYKYYGFSVCCIKD